MKKIAVLSSLLTICFVIAAQTQATAAKPDPELKKLHPWVGHWTYEAEYKPGPLGRGGKATAEYEGKMILGGFLYQGRWREKGPAGETSGLEIDGYDPVNKNIFSDWYTDDGGRFSGTMSVTGNTLTWSGKCFLAGKQYMGRATFTLSADLMSAPFKIEISTDGTTWIPFEEGKYTKVKPAPKK
jgi:hypothetical protein